MLFNSWTFIAFLALVLAAWRCATIFDRHRIGLAIILAASCVFYAWDGLRFFAIFSGSIVGNLAFGNLIHASSGRRRLTLTTTAVIANICLLGWFKYAGFFASILGINHSWINEIALPIGISFYTFVQIAFIIDIHRGVSTDLDWLRYGLFVTFFPHLIAGPIIHHREVMPQFERAPRRSWTRDLAVGLSIFATGLAKKVLLADPLSLVADPVFAAAAERSSITMIDAWAGVLAYHLQIYFDFSGYSDMAIGISRMFGIHLPVNFIAPYRSLSITEFWRRWHVTLSRFLRDYLYIPLGGNRLGRAKQARNLALVMLLGGLWHGAGWGFVLWGALHGMALAIAILWRQFLPKLPAAISWALTFLFVAFAWIPFRAIDLEAAGQVFLALALGAPPFMENFDASGSVRTAVLQVIGLAEGGGNFFGMLVVLPVALAVVLVAPSTAMLFRKVGGAGTRSPGYPLPTDAGWRTGTHWAFRLDARWACVVGFLLATCLAKLNDVSSFIYFRF